MTQSLFRRIYREWLPKAEYEKLDGPDVEIYGDAGNGYFYSEVWIAVVPKPMK